MNRLEVPRLAATLFAAAHLPNPFLVPVSFFGGWAAAALYLRHRNLYVLGLAHVVVGCTYYLAVPIKKRAALHNPRGVASADHR